jgi:hypothetical protein
MSRFRSLLLLPLLIGSAAAADVPHYAVRFDATTGQAAVRLCLAQAHDAVTFAADSAWAMRFVHDLRRDRDDELVADDGAWRAADWRAGECLAYRADLAAIAAAQRADVGWRLGEDLVTAPQLWLLRPDVPQDADAHLQLALPAGWAVSAPWHADAAADASGQSIQFTIPNTPPDWAAAVAIGRFAEERIELPGGALRLVVLHGVDAEQRAVLRDWLAHVARAVLAAYGRLPLADVQVLMIPLPGRGRAVLFGQSIRGQGNALELLVDPTRPAAEFADDWIAVHELSHLLHPYLGERGSWLAEGLATYYQNVLRGRAGLLRPTQAWDRLREGFAANTGRHYASTLAQAAAEMHRRHDYRRVYWSGAAYWLTVDRDLRRASTSLDRALARFRDCCLPARREWTPEEFVARLDALLGVSVVSARYREFAALRQFPDWENVYRDLGIRADAAGLRFDDAAPDAAVREAILPTRSAP